jgi:hypothetical protein
VRAAIRRIADAALARLPLMRRRAFRAAFLNGQGELRSEMIPVLADLRRFCKATVSTFDPDPRVHAMLEGRREVFWRIIGFLNVDEAEVLKLVEAYETESDDA